MANSSSGDRLQIIVIVAGLAAFMAVVYGTVKVAEDSPTGSNSPNAANHGPRLPGAPLPSNAALTPEPGKG